VTHARVDQRELPRRPQDPLTPDLPQEAVALTEPAGAVPAPILIARAMDVAEDAILVAVSKEVLRVKEIHNRNILHFMGRKSN